ncbi:uncharacterized protein [Paramisgurnus dabryanus]|uniref:uncharacterized protein isoform X2 n=1 Tax=Paramisgurnus dabryanus TaxID=90735 RepID=UPI003CCFB8D7
MVAVFLLVCISLKLFLQTQGQNIQKAKIYSISREITEGDNLEVTCSTFGYTTKSVYLYLCQNGKAIDMKKQCNHEDTVFRIQHIEKNKTGNYSCVFSEDCLKTTEVMEYGDNHIFINVTDSKTLIPAEIHLLESQVPEGSDAEFTCTPSKSLHRTQTRQLILAILIKNGTNVSVVNIFDPKETMATFTLKKVRKDDTGTYSCVVMLNTIFHPEKLVYGNNDVDLHITDSKTAEIHLLESEVPEGSDAEFTCTPSKFLNTNRTRFLILIKKGTNTSIVNILDPKETMAIFTLRKVRKDDAGTYSCVVMLNTHLYPEKWVYGNNEVILHITDAPVVFSSTGEVRILIVSLIVLLFIILLLGILTMIEKQGSLGCLNERCLENEGETREVVRVRPDDEDLHIYQNRETYTSSSCCHEAHHTTDSQAFLQHDAQPKSDQRPPAPATPV